MYRGAICCTFGGAGTSTTKNKLQIYHASVNWGKVHNSSITDSIIFGIVEKNAARFGGEMKSESLA